MGKQTWTAERREANRAHLARARANAAAKRQVRKEATNGTAATVTRPVVPTTPPAPIAETFTVPAAPAAPAPGFALPRHYTDEGIAERAEASAYKLAPCVEVTLDEMDKRLRSPYDPFKETAQPYLDANPDKRFAYQSPRIQKHLGTRDMLPVIGTDGKPVEVAGQSLYYESKSRFEMKQKLNAQMAEKQAAAAEESYREIAERIRRARNTIGDDVQVLRDGETVSGVGHTFSGSGQQVDTESVGVPIGIKTGYDPSIVR